MINRENKRRIFSRWAKNYSVLLVWIGLICSSIFLSEKGSGLTRTSSAHTPTRRPSTQQRLPRTWWLLSAIKIRRRDASQFEVFLITTNYHKDLNSETAFN
ncbi:hypothetical protein Plhal304r1_c010g0041001 [Plasmopara halstedii]